MWKLTFVSVFCLLIIVSLKLTQFVDAYNQAKKTEQMSCHNVKYISGIDGYYCVLYVSNSHKN